MRKTALSLLILFLTHSSWGQLFPNLGGQRVGTSAAQFLKIGIGARAMALGEAYVAVANDASALHWNPAGISQFSSNEVVFSYNRWFADLQITYAGAVYHLDPANTFGAFCAALYCDDMQETTELQPFGTGRYFSYGDMLAGVTYARNMTDKFSFGLTLKYLQETMAELTMRSVLFDLGTYYKTGWKTIRFAVAVSNFANELGPEGSYTYEDLANNTIKVTKFQKFSPPIIFRIGLAGEIFQKNNHKVTTSIQLNHPNDNSENLNWGVEYWMANVLALRAGYITSRADRDFSFGAGLRLPIARSEVRLDYSLVNFGRLGYVSQYTLHLGL